jgi:hypothetical protein
MLNYNLIVFLALLLIGAQPSFGRSSPVLSQLPS